MYIAYSLLLVCVFVLLLPWWIFQVLRSSKYRTGLQERLGIVPQRLKDAAKPGAIWIHAVSVGEVMAVTALVKKLQQTCPERKVFVSTTTVTGQFLARGRFGENAAFFLPMDFGFAIRPYLHLLQPRLLVLAETEFWPNLLHLARSGGAGVAVVNARVSDRSFPRYRRFRWFFRRVLAGIDLFLTQTEEDARRLIEIGAEGSRVQVSGNLKFDVAAADSASIVEELRRAIPRESLVLVCGSTAEGEEEALVKAFQEIVERHPAAIMLIAPRHPERFDRVYDMIEAEGVPCLRRSAWTPSRPLPGKLLLLDSVGELASIYALADLAFVGGSLVPLGGHNILEPARHGVPIITGPYTFNFREIIRIFVHGEALRVVTPQNLSHELLSLMADRAQRESLGRRARALFEEHAGATQKTLQALLPFLEQRRATTP